MLDLVGNPEDRFSHNEAHLTFFLQASRGHNEALHVLLGCIMNLDIKDVNGKITEN